jgi:hypothetical protein
MTIFHSLQRQLFPTLEVELGPPTTLDQQFCEVLSPTQLGRFANACGWRGQGCPPCPHVAA